jgi:hypothetical protein
MASYITGITDYIPQLQHFRPDYNFYAGVLQHKQNKYDNNFERLNSVYNSILNAPMSRDSNIHRRDEYFRAAEQNLKKIAGMDLSLDENQAMAMKVFEPFYEDQHIINDIAKTKQAQNAFSKLEQLRNCVDPKKCGDLKYSDNAAQYLNYKMDEFRKASDDEALSFGSFEAIPDVNLYEKAAELAKDFNIKYDEVKGGYIISHKNGQPLEGHLLNHFSQVLGADPRLKAMFKRDAYLQRKNEVAAGVEKYGSEEASEQAYVSKIQQTTLDAHKQVMDENESLIRNLEKKKALFEEQLKKTGGRPVNERDQAWYEALTKSLENANHAKEIHKDTQANIEGMQNSNNNNSLRNTVDGIVSNGLFGSAISAAAKNLAYKDYEQTMKADPFALSSHSSNLALRNQKTMAQINFTKQWELNKQKHGFNVEMHMLKNMDTENPDPLGVTTVNAPAGGYTVGENHNTADLNREQLDNQKGNFNYVKDRYLETAFTELKSQYAKGDQAIKNSIELMVQDLFKESGLNPKEFFNQDSHDIVKSLKAEQTDKIYKTATEKLNPQDPLYGKAGWVDAFYEKTSDMRTSAEVQRQALDKMQDFHANQAKTTVQRLGNEYANQDIKGYAANKIIPQLIDKTGRIKPKEQFIQDAAKATDKFNTDTASSLGKVYDKLTEDYQEIYQSHGKAFDGLLLAGGHGGEKASKGTQMTVIGGRYKDQTVKLAKDFYNNWDPTSSTVFFGEADQKDPKADPTATTLVKQLFMDLSKPGKATDKGNPAFTMRYQGVAGHSSDRVGIHINNIDQEWAKKYQGTKNNPGPLYGVDFSKGVTIYVPKNEANFELNRLHKVNSYDFMLENGGIEVNSYPQAGKLKITKDETTGLMRAHGEVVAFKEDKSAPGGWIKYTDYYNDVIPHTMTPEGAAQHANRILAERNRAIRQKEEEIAKAKR